MTTKAGVRQVVKALTSDPEYRESWKANIAMSFYDEVRRDPIFSNDQGAASAMTHDKLHTISNKAADNFLNLLCRDNE